MNKPLITVSETSAFSRRADKLLSADERRDLIDVLASNPETGDEIQGLSGVRKVRFGAKGKGKSGGVRVIYYYYDGNHPLLAIFLYGKNEQADLTAEQAHVAAKIAEIDQGRVQGEEEA